MTTDPIELITQQRDAFLDSPNLDPAWIAGWHAAIDHTESAARAASHQPMPDERVRIVLDDLRAASDTTTYVYDTDSTGRTIAVAYSDDGDETGRYVVGVTLTPLTSDGDGEASDER